MTPLIEKLDEGIFITIPKEAGYGAMTLKDYGPHTIGGYHTPRSRPRVDSDWMSNISPGLAYGQQIFKKGGRVDKALGGRSRDIG